MRKYLSFPACGLLFLIPALAVPANPGFSGHWEIERDLSTAIDPWRNIVLDISVNGERVVIDQLVAAGSRRSSQTYELDISKKENVLPVKWWTGNRHIGAYMGGDGTMKIQAKWIDDGQTLRLESHFVLQTSQGETPVRTYTEYRLSRDGKRLTVMELRSSRNRPTLHVFTRN